MVSSSQNLLMNCAKVGVKAQEEVSISLLVFPLSKIFSKSGVEKRAVYTSRIGSFSHINSMFSTTKICQTTPIISSLVLIIHHHYVLLLRFIKTIEIEGGQYEA